MNRFADSSSEYDSEEDGDQINPHFLTQIGQLQLSKSAGRLPSAGEVMAYERHDYEPEEEEPEALQPKMKDQIPDKAKDKNTEVVMPNFSSLSGASVNSRTNRRPLTAAYTFKLKPSPSSGQKKKNDPVALFQQTSQAWKKDKFLTNRAHNKEGRKLELDKRNKLVSKAYVE